MKPLVPFIIFFFFAYNATGQKLQKNPPTVNQEFTLNPSNQKNPGSRCASDELLQQVIRKFPSYLSTVKSANSLLNQEVKKRIDRQLFKKELAASSLPVNIPVVVHIVAPQPELITDAAVQSQIDRLNLDFSGLNPDSTNLSPTYSYTLRGHSNIRFTLAKKDPGNNATTGIERRCSDIRFTVEPEDPIKLTASGGLDAWDPGKYLNIWVGNSGIDGLLGYSTYPFSVADYVQPPLRFHGITLNQFAFANNTSLYAFNRGRTLVHEMGHFLGLFHIFQGGCMNQDFSTAAFDAGNTDDTPLQLNPTGSGGTSSCPSGKIASGCSGNTSGRLFQNFMDYTDDPCLSMFTANQVVRMETALDMFYPSLKTSDAVNLPPVYSTDVQVLASKAPYGGNPAFMECNSATGSISFCSNINPLVISPLLQIRNTGTSALTEIEIWYKAGDSSAVLNQKITFATPLASRDTAMIQLKPISLAHGSYNLRLFTINPNNIADENPLNDTVSIPLEVELPQKSPVIEGFETTGFPPAGWKLDNKMQDNYTWKRTQLGFKSGTASLFLNFFEYDEPGRIDELVSPALDISLADSILFSFEHAYKQYDTAFKDYSDTLEILVSEDCGGILKSIWKKGGSALATVNGSTGLYNWAPSAGDWKNTSIDLRSMVSKSASSIRIIFRAKNGYGQNLYVDDIALKGSFRSIRDARIVSTPEPVNRVCSGLVTPTLVIENLGEDTLRKLAATYAIDGGNSKTLSWTGNLKKFQRDTVYFPAVSLPGSGVHQIRFFISSPNDLQDQNLANDTVSTRVMVFNQISAPVKEGFESAIFPPAGWDISTSTEVFKWERAINASSELVAAAWLNNNSNTSFGSVQELYSPIIQVGATDSLLLRFDFAHVTAEYPVTTRSTDTLQILITTDCGRTYTPIYKKWGAQLNTLNMAYPGVFTRDSIGFVPNLRSHWRTDSINIRKILAGARSFQLLFRNINNNDNNIFLDNIRVNTVILPDELKKKGYHMMPNPTTGVVNILHSLPPLNLEGIQVVNAGGHLVLTQRYKGNAPANIPVDLTNRAAGIYIIRLQYKDHSVTEKIIKLN